MVLAALDFGTGPTWACPSARHLIDEGFHSPYDLAFTPHRPLYGRLPVAFKAPRIVTSLTGSDVEHSHVGGEEAHAHSHEGSGHEHVPKEKALEGSLEREEELERGSVELPAPLKVPEVCKDNICKCSEGHRCVMKTPMKYVHNHHGSGDHPSHWDGTYMLGCPATDSGHSELSTVHYSKDNPECKNEDKANPDCVCVLHHEPVATGELRELIRVPTVTGRPEVLEKRFVMPPLTDDMMYSVTDEGKWSHAESKEKPKLLDATAWKNEFILVRPRMGKIMDFLEEKITKIEGAESREEKHEHAEEESGKDVGKASPKQEAQMQAAEVGSADMIEKFESFGEMCQGLEDTAQAVGLANTGEAEHMNCFKDPDEMEKLEKSMGALEKTVEETPVMEDGGSKSGGAPTSSGIDEWTLAAISVIPPSRFTIPGSSVRGPRKGTTSRCQLGEFLSRSNVDCDIFSAKSIGTWHEFLDC